MYEDTGWIVAYIQFIFGMQHSRHDQQDAAHLKSLDAA